MLILHVNYRYINVFGLSGQALSRGVKTWVFWLLYFGMTALVAGIVLYLAEVNLIEFDWNRVFWKPTSFF